jgi:hypothetical protein
VNTSRKCAYCDTGEGLTNEHVVPDFYSKAFGETISIVQTPTDDKAVSSPQEIKDVCASCNSGALSLLDEYLSALNKKYFSTIIHAGDRVCFEYDFDLLQRVLLKVAYNVARTRKKWPVWVFQEMREFILSDEAGPSGLRIFLQLLVPTPVRRTSLPVTQGTTEVPPLPWRAELYDVSGLPGLVFVYSVSFMSYRFFVLQEDMNTHPAIRKRSVARWLKQKQNNGTIELTSKCIVTLYSSSVTVIDAVKESPIFEIHLQKARKLKADMQLKTSKSR